MKLGLGTVQWGMDYGVSNPHGQTSLAQVAIILQQAAEAGIQILDSAALYGNSEAVLGETLPENHPFKIITKTHRYHLDGSIGAADGVALEAAFQGSLKRLKQPWTYALLSHAAEDLLAPGGEHLFTTMQRLQQAGLVEKIGCSVYQPEEVDALLERYPLEIVQLPMNVLDQRFIQGGQLARLKERGVEIHARSLFLQGLLLMPLEQIPNELQPWSQPIKRYDDHLKQRGWGKLESALGFALNCPEVDHLIVGVNDAEQLQQILSALKDNPVDQNLSEWASTEQRLINPSLWPALSKK